MGRAEPVMGAVASKLSGTDPSAVATRNGTIGFFAALGFLSFVGTFNERFQSYKAAQGKNKRKTSKIAQGLDKILRAILSKTCNIRELMTVLGLSLCLLLRTLGSVWVAKEWGKIVGAIVTRNWQSLLRLVSVFAGGTMSLAVLNAYLKYYISLLKENVREKMTYWCHKEYLKGNKEMIFTRLTKSVTRRSRTAITKSHPMSINLLSFSRLCSRPSPCHPLACSLPRSNNSMGNSAVLTL